MCSHTAPADVVTEMRPPGGLKLNQLAETIFSPFNQTEPTVELEGRGQMDLLF